MSIFRLCFVGEYAHAAFVAVRLFGVCYGVSSLKVLTTCHCPQMAFLSEMNVAFVLLFGGFAASSLAEETRQQHNLTWFGYSS